MNTDDFNQALLAFLDTSPTPFHAAAGMASALTAAGFTRLNESDDWHLAAGGCYFVARNESSLVAFSLGSGDVTGHGLRLVGAHTDSPCLRLKPQPVITAHGYRQFGVEVYGGALLNPWFDRDLSLAGRVSFRTADRRIASRLVDFREPLAVIPSLAIHLDREVNRRRSINPQTDLPALFGNATGEPPTTFPTLLLDHLRARYPACAAATVLDFELSLYDCQPPARIGLHREYIAAARLDNLVSCFAGLQALIAAAPAPWPAVLVATDHEEVGSASACGAQGPFLREVLERLCGGSATLTRALHRSVMISADNAHALHPNYADKHDAGHAPRLNGGPVIKINASQRYASNSQTTALFRDLCARTDVPVQTFVARADMACGSTIGPITAAELGVPTVDVGVPQLAMHSIRELAGAADPVRLARVLVEFYRRESLRGD